jgi:hypothetical protein
MDIMLKRYRQHRHNAKGRSISFRLSFEEWRKLWLDSGRWVERGWRKGQYVMRRPGDQGAYELGNVEICLAEENRAERCRNYRLFGARNGAFGKNYWLASSQSRRDAISHAISLRLKGKPKSAEQRAKMSVTATGRRRVLRDGHAVWAHPGDVDFPYGTY